MYYRINDDLSDISEDSLNDILSRLPQWRQDVVMRYKHFSKRRESAMAFSLLTDILREEYAISQEIHFAFGEHGKPSLSGCEGIFFNMSHCKEAVACAVSEQEVGIDIESLGRYKQSLAEHTLSAEELSLLSHASFDGLSPEASKDLLFTILWTKKEAVLKLLGTGITDSLTNILSLYTETIDFNTIINIPKKYVCTIATFKTER